jgi:hypothetical protein
VRCGGVAIKRRWVRTSLLAPIGFRPSPVGALKTKFRRRASILELRNDPKIAQWAPAAAWPCRYAPSHSLPVDRFLFPSSPTFCDGRGLIIERGYRPSGLCRPSVKLTPQNMPDRNDSTIIQLYSSSEKRGRDVESLISMISIIRIIKIIIIIIIIIIIGSRDNLSSVLRTQYSTVTSDAKCFSLLLSLSLSCDLLMKRSPSARPKRLFSLGESGQSVHFTGEGRGKLHWSSLGTGGSLEKATRGYSKVRPSSRFLTSRPMKRPPGVFLKTVNQHPLPPLATP